MSTAPMTTADALRAVRTRLLSHGWEPSGPRCLLATFDRVIKTDTDWKDAGRPAWEAMRQSIGVPSLVAWNHADHELPDVICAIDRTLEDLPA